MNQMEPNSHNYLRIMIITGILTLVLMILSKSVVAYILS